MLLRNSDYISCLNCRTVNKMDTIRCSECGEVITGGADFYRQSVVTTIMQNLQSKLSVPQFPPPLIVDTHQYYPEGTVDADYIKQNYTAWNISVGIGMRMGARYLEQIKLARERDIPVVLWHIPDCEYGLAEQVQEVFSWPHVKDYVFCMDIERPRASTRVINAQEFKTYAQEVEKLSKWLPMVYSTEGILSSIFGESFPSWYQYWHWIAQYVYNIYPSLYFCFSDFIKIYGCQLPFSVRKSPLFMNDSVHMDSVVEWQFTNKGKEPFVFPGGPLSRDLSVGTIPASDLLSKVIHYLPASPEPIDVSADVQAHSIAMLSHYNANNQYFNNLAGQMQATHTFPFTGDKTLEEKHIVEVIATKLGIPFVPYLYKGFVATRDGLNVRNSPIYGSPIVRKIPWQSEVTVYEETPSVSDAYTWGRIDPTKQEWIAVSHNFIQKI